MENAVREVAKSAPFKSVRATPHFGLFMHPIAMLAYLGHIMPMPKGPQGQKRPADVIGNAVHIMRIATGQRNYSAAASAFSRISFAIKSALFDAC